MRLIATAFILSLALIMPREAAAHDEPSGAVLTVIGAIELTNRGGFDAFDDAFLNFHGKEFGSAFSFDRETLLGLPQLTITANAEGWPRAVTATGPRLSDVLSKVGAADAANLTLVALDGYGAPINSDERAARDWILALTVDGRPLGLGGRGPSWLLYETGDTPASAEEEGKWVWSVFLIEVD